MKKLYWHSSKNIKRLFVLILFPISVAFAVFESIFLFALCFGPLTGSGQTWLKIAPGEYLLTMIMHGIIFGISMFGIWYFINFEKLEERKKMNMREIVQNIRNGESQKPINDWLFFCNFGLFEEPQKEGDCSVAFVEEVIVNLLSNLIKNYEDLDLTDLEKNFKEKTGKKIKIILEKTGDKENE